MAGMASVEDVKKAVAAATADPIMLTVFSWILEFKGMFDAQKERDRAIMFGLAHLMAAEGPYSHALEMLRKVYDEQYVSPLPNIGEPDPFGDPEMQLDLGSLLQQIDSFRQNWALVLDNAIDRALDDFLSVPLAGRRLSRRSRYTREQWAEIARGAYEKWRGG